MGQEEVIKILKKERWMKVSEMSKKLNQCNTTINHSLRRLYHHGEILKRESTGYPKCFEFKLK